MKIAVMGSASSSVMRAPFKNARLEAWQEGKVDAALQVAHDSLPGEFDIWGCSPGCWAVIPRATRWFEVHRWEAGVPWFSPQYVQFLRDFKGPVYTGGRVPEVANHVVYPIDRMEEIFSSYFMTSSLALMLALAIDTIEQIREARKEYRGQDHIPMAQRVFALPAHVSDAELTKDDSDDVIGLWGVDMAAHDEYAYQRPGCQFFVIEAMRRGIGVYLPPESDLMRPMPVYGISEWDHNYIKLTSRAKELSVSQQQAQQQIAEAQQRLGGIQGEQHALNYFVSTWTSPYGMLPGLVLRQDPGTGMGSGITQIDGRPITRMGAEEPAPAPAAEAPEVVAMREALAVLYRHASPGETPLQVIDRLAQGAQTAGYHSSLLQPHMKAGESTVEAMHRLFIQPEPALVRATLKVREKKAEKKRRR